MADKESPELESTERSSPLTNKWLWLAAIGLLVILVVVFEPTRFVIGKIRGEVFYGVYPESYWAGGLASEDPEHQRSISDQLIAGGSDAVAVLIALLDHQDSSVQWQSAELLGKIGPAARDATDKLIELLSSDDSHLRQVCASALPRVDAPADKTVPSLVKLCNKEPSVEVTRALSKYGPAAAESLDVLIAVMEDESLPTEVRWNAIRTIGKIREPAAPAIDKLMVMMKHKEDTIREHAAEALGDIGPKSERAVDALVGMLNDSATRVRRDAVRSLGQIGGSAQAKLKEIRKLTKDKEEIVRNAAKTALKALSK